ncbi:MAG: tail fiber protein [Syntrophomonadaceae bacterium]|nr:tail fiber protein [Syntrophomonadaceae bacterium]
MEPYIGQIQAFSFNYAPRGWVVCDGQLLSVAQYQPLFALLGPRFGGNGTTTFAVPDLRNASLANSCLYYIATEGLWPSQN